MFFDQKKYFVDRIFLKCISWFSRIVLQRFPINPGNCKVWKFLKTRAPFFSSSFGPETDDLMRCSEVCAMFSNSAELTLSFSPLRKRCKAPIEPHTWDRTESPSRGTAPTPPMVNIRLKTRVPIFDLGEF